MRNNVVGGRSNLNNNFELKWMYYTLENIGADLLGTHSSIIVRICCDFSALNFLA